MSSGQLIFTFKEIPVTDAVLNILISDIRRPLRPAVWRRKIEIPGRDGAWDFGPGVKRDFEIEVDFTIRAADTGALMAKMRSLAVYLDGKGPLVFSDDLTKVYQAQVLQLIVPERRVFSAIRSGTIVFECDA
jgi:predicted phage tail component-like protein